MCDALIIGMFLLNKVLYFESSNPYPLYCIITEEIKGVASLAEPFCFLNIIRALVAKVEPSKG